MEDINEKKKKVGLYLNDDTYLEVKSSYHKDGCRSLTEFMERAVIYYLGFVNSEHESDYLSPTIMSSVKAASDENTKPGTHKKVALFSTNFLASSQTFIYQEILPETLGRSYAETCRRPASYLILLAVLIVSALSH